MNENLLTPRVARRWQDVMVSYFTCQCCGGEWSLERFPDSAPKNWMGAHLHCPWCGIAQRPPHSKENLND